MWINDTIPRGLLYNDSSLSLQGLSLERGPPPQTEPFSSAGTCGTRPLLDRQRSPTTALSKMLNGTKDERRFQARRRR